MVEALAGEGVAALGKLVMTAAQRKRHEGTMERVSNAVAKKYNLALADERVMAAMKAHKKNRMERPYGLEPTLFDFTEQTHIDGDWQKYKDLCANQEKEY